METIIVYDFAQLRDQHPPILEGGIHMNFKRFKIRGVIALSFALVVTLAIVFTAMSMHRVARAAGGLPTITSDQADYSPGSTVNLTGAGWASGEGCPHLRERQRWQHVEPQQQS